MQSYPENNIEKRESADFSWEKLPEYISEYCEFFNEELGLFGDILKNPDLQNRKNMQGHLATKSFLLSNDGSKVLLLHHKALDKWLQPGGHVDIEDKSLVEAARRELIEETGLSSVFYFPVNLENRHLPINIECSQIPERLEKEETEHTHYDFSFVFVARENASLTIDQSESNGANWISFEEFKQNTNFTETAIRIEKYIGSRLNNTLQNKE